jgi:nitrogen regulatory protein PII
MKKIDAIVRPHRLEEIVNRLRLVGVAGVTVTEVYGVSRSTAVESVFRGQRYRTPSAPRYEVMLVVPDALANAAVSAIAVAGRTDEPGDGLVAVSDVLAAYRIRTGESGPDAL